MPTIIVKVDLDCSRCHAKIHRVIDRIQEKGEFCIDSVEYDEKKNRVIVSGPFDAEKLADKLCCKACSSIKEIEIVEPPKPKPDKPKEEKPKPPPPQPEVVKPPPPPAVVKPAPPPKEKPAPPPKVVEVPYPLPYPYPWPSAGCCCHHGHGGCSCGGGNQAPPPPQTHPYPSCAGAPCMIVCEEDPASCTIM